MRMCFFGGILCLISSVQLLAQSADSLISKNPNNKSKSIIKIFAAPVVLVGLGLYTKQNGTVLNRFAVNDWRNNNFPNFSNHSDDAMQFMPIAIVYGVDLVHVRPKDDLLNRTIILVKSEILMNGIVQFLKQTTHIARPDGANTHSFPSGHTAQAFVAATFMHQELGHKSVWYSIGAYSMASTVGLFRVLNNRHWISDVLAGAGIGILSTKIAYATHRYKWGKRPGLVALPTYNNGPGIFISWRIDP